MPHHVGMAPRLPQPDLSKLTEAQKDQLIIALVDQVNVLLEQVETLTAQVAGLTARVEQLTAQANKDSSNSSKPPSSDGLGKKTRSLRISSGKKPGGQVGRKGTTLRQAEPTEVITHPLPRQCERCHAVLPLEQARLWSRRQVIDVPMTPFDVVEHRTLAVTCGCGQLHTSTFPAGIDAAVQYGPNVKALGVHLTQGQLLPFARAADLIADLYGLAVSPATLVAWVADAGVALRDTAAQIAGQLRIAPVLHGDESGLRVAGKLHWLHVTTTETLTWYGVHGKRGVLAMQAHGILPQHHGVLVHDCWAPYWKLDGVTHALCNAHLLRELLYVRETTGQPWAQRMSDFLLTASKLREAVKAQGRRFTPDDVQALRTVFDRIVRDGEADNPGMTYEKGARGKQSTAANLLRRLRLHADAVLRFVSDFSVPFTNNEAERAVRMPKVKQKISGCFRTLEGAQHFCTIRSVLDTLRKQGHGMFTVLKHAFAGNPIQSAA